MREQLKTIKTFLAYKEDFFRKKDMGYPISQEEYDKYNRLKQEATNAKAEIEKETKEIKKILKRVK